MTKRKQLRTVRKHPRNASLVPVPAGVRPSPRLASPPPASVPPHDLHQSILTLHRRAGKDLILLGGLLKAMRDTESFKALGHDSFREYIAQPELGMRQSWAYALVQAFETAVALGLPPERAAEIDVSKLALIGRQVIKALKDGKTGDAGALLEDARMLSRSDLRLKLAGEPEAGEAESAEEKSQILDLLRKQILGRLVRRVDYDGHTFSVEVEGKDLTERVDVFSPNGRILVRMGTV